MLGGGGPPGPLLILHPHSEWEGVNRPGAAGTLLRDQLVCTNGWPFLQIATVDSKPVILL